MIKKIFQRKKKHADQRESKLFDHLMNVRMKFRDKEINQDLLVGTLNYMFQMADSQSEGMWVKNRKLEYVFANKTVRRDLFNGMSVSEIMGKTDTQILGGKEIPNSTWEDLSKITPKQLPKIANYVEEGTKICNLTDIITISFEKPCQFVESVEDFLLIVWKAPIIDKGMVVGTSGRYVNVTHDRQYVFSRIAKLKEHGVVHQIDGLASFYFAAEIKPNLNGASFL